MLPRLVQRQLAAFAIVSVLAMSLLGVRYLEIPEGLGIGRFDVTVPISHASGLYPNAPVTYRGVQIGKVSDMRLSRAGTVATLSLADGSDVPASARVEVRNGSVIGEPFLNLVAAPGAGTDRSLRDGDRIPGNRVTLPVSTGAFLTEVNELVGSIPTDPLRTALGESATVAPAVTRIPGASMRTSLSTRSVSRPVRRGMCMSSRAMSIRVLWITSTASSPQAASIKSKYGSKIARSTSRAPESSSAISSR